MLNFYIFIIFKINNNYRTEASLMKIMKKENRWSNNTYLH